MGTRAESRQQTAARVVAAASGLFSQQGYGPTTVPQIAAEAGVSVGTVASVGSKDALFLRSWEESSTAASLALIAEAATASDSVTERVWTYIGHMVEATIAAPDAVRDYFVAYLRASDHAANLGRLNEVGAALRGLFPDEPPEEDSLAKGPFGSPAELASWTIWLAFSAVCFGLAASSYPPEDARALMRAVVESQCAPFEEKGTHR